MYAEFIKDVCELVVDEFGVPYDGPLMDTIPGYIDLCFDKEDGETLRLILAPNGMVTVSIYKIADERTQTIAIALFSPMGPNADIPITVLDTATYRDEDEVKMRRVIKIAWDARAYLMR
jgi:hypothetical protein